MDIIGSGLDAIEIGRVAEALARYGDRFVRRLFTAGEQAYCRGKRDAASSFAARFAAKEAAMKALGTGYSRGVHRAGIEVVLAGTGRRSFTSTTARPCASPRWAVRARC